MRRRYFLQRHGQFPSFASFASSDFPLSPISKAYTLQSRPWLETLLPWGKAQLAGLMFYAIIPVLLIELAVLACILKLFDWRVNSAVHHFHGDLEFLESGIESAASESPIAHALAAGAP